MEDPNVYAHLQAIEQTRKTIISSTLSRFSIPDILSQGPLTTQEIINHFYTLQDPSIDALFGERPRTLDHDNLERLLRSAAAGGLLTESQDRKFGLTPLTAVLVSSHPSQIKYSLQHIISDKSSSVCWNYLGEVIVDPSYKPWKNLGCDNLFDFYKKEPFEYINFHKTMLGRSNIMKNQLVKVFNFGDYKRVVDIGGSTGHLVKHILNAFPQVEKGIDFDLPEVVEKYSKEEDVSSYGDRLEFVAGDFFKSVVEGDCYVIKSILHDWNDDDTLRILETIARAMNHHSVLLVVEFILKDFGESNNSFLPHILDLQMLLLLHGKERRRDQWEGLYERAGLRLERIIPVDAIQFIMVVKKV